MFKLTGSCHCRSITVDLELSQPPDSYRPRACDCDFCRKHRAAYLSDPKGTLRIHVRDVSALGRYQQGSGTADCLYCIRCGVLVGVAYQEGEQVFAAVNSRIIDGDVRLGEDVTVSPKALGVDDKIKRWREVWFSDVALV